LYQFLSLFDWYAASEGDLKVKGRTLNKAKLKEIEVDFPRFLPEQQRIVSIIDKAFEAIDKAIENTQKNLRNAKELFENYLQRVFQDNGDGWEVKTLGDVCEYDKTPCKSDDLPYVGLEDIQSNTGIFVGPFEPRKMKSLTFYFNDEHVLYGRLRPYLNKVLQPHFEGHCSTEIFPIKPKKNLLDRGFLFRWLIATETMKQINNTWTGATLPRANMNAVLEFSINLHLNTNKNSLI
jgi:type I restriction enzyme S subunit